MNLQHNTDPLNETDKNWFKAATQVSLTPDEIKVVAFYLRRGYSLKEVARLFIESQKTQAQ